MRQGEVGEELATGYLLGLGYRIAERNWRSGKRGEIDIIAYDDQTLVFVEVKERRRGSIGRPAEALTSSKKKRLVELAREYLYRTGLYGTVDCRFDVIGVERGRTKSRVEHIVDAFRA